MRRVRRAGRFSFTERSISADTVTSIVLGIIALVLLVFVLKTSIASAGQSNETNGFVFLVSVVVTAWGGIFTLFSMRGEGGMPALKRVGVVFNAIAALIIAIVILISLTY